MQLQKYYIGVDVSKETLDFCLVKEGKKLDYAKVANQQKTINHLLTKWSKQLNYTYNEVIVCMENTGIYCNPLLHLLQKTQAKVCVENAYNIKYSQGLQRGKNDQIDAERIALYAYKNRERLQTWKAPAASTIQLKELANARTRLKNVLRQLQVPLKEMSPFIDKSIVQKIAQRTASSIKAINADIKEIEKEMMRIINSEETLSKMFAILASVEGVGAITAIMFIITTNGFTTFTEGKKFACYAGVVPFQHQSGTSVKGKTKVSPFANKKAKTALHLSALSLVKSKGELGEYYRRKVGEGKNKMSVLNAVRNKIILRVFACIKQNKKYEIRHQAQAA